MSKKLRARIVGGTNKRCAVCGKPRTAHPTKATAKLPSCLGCFGPGARQVAR